MGARGVCRRSFLGGTAASSLLLAERCARAQLDPFGTPELTNIGDTVDDPNEPIVITANDVSFAMPTRIPAGTLTLTLVNAGQADHAAQLIELEADALIPDVIAALRRDWQQAMTIARLSGGPGHTAPGAYQTVIQELPSGRYMVIDTALGPNGAPQFLSEIPRPFEVVDLEIEQTAQLPSVDLAVDLDRDAFFGLPSEIKAGQQIWRVSNLGTKSYELGFRRVLEGATADDVIAEVMSAPAGTPTSAGVLESLRLLSGLPVSPAGGVQAMAPGLFAWVAVDLQPGEYVALSAVPSDEQLGMVQAQLGMIQGFTVTPA